MHNIKSHFGNYETDHGQSFFLSLKTSAYSFHEHKKTLQLQLLDLESGQSMTLYKDSNYSEPTWVSDTKFLFIKSGDKGSSSLMFADVKNPGAPSVSPLSRLKGVC